MSIKKKFATAVATASLLAGLFGSAFVPSALAAGRTPTIPVVKPAVTEVYSGGGVNDASTTTARDAGKNRTFAFYSGSNAGGDNVALTQDKDSSADASDNDASIGFVFYSSTSGGAGDDLFDFVTNELDLMATSSNSGVLLAWAYADDGDKTVDCEDLDTLDGGDSIFSTSDTVNSPDYWNDEPGFDDGSDDVWILCLAAATPTTAATSTITVKANGITAATITVTAIGPIASVTLSATDGTNVAESNLAVDNFWQVVAKDSAGTVINGNQGSATKAAGLSSLDLDFDHLGTNPKNQNANVTGLGSVIEPLDLSGDTAVITADGYGAYQYFALNDAICKEDSGLAAGGIAEGDGDEGKSYELKVTYDATTDITSNGVTILCTGGWEGATVTSVTVDATSGGLTYENLATGDLITMTGVMKDSAGRLLGAGSKAWDDSEVVSADSVSSVDGDVDSTFYTNGKGEFIIDEFTPSVPTAKKYGYSVTVIVNAGAYENEDDDVATTKKYSFTYTASDSDATSIVPTVNRNASKTRATITVDCGVADSLEIIAWEVELANGNIVDYDRKANIDGVVKLTLSRRNTTVRVQAFCTDGDSEIAIVRFR